MLQEGPTCQSEAPSAGNWEKCLEMQHPVSDDVSELV